MSKNFLIGVMGVTLLVIAGVYFFNYPPADGKNI